MAIEKFLADLLHQGMQLWVENGELRFRAPKGVLTPTLRDDIVHNKPALVAKLGEEKKFTAVTSAQQRLWFMDQLVPNSPLYNIPALFHIRGKLDFGVLERCLEEIVRRHEVLRAVFTQIDGQPFQIILPTNQVIIRRVNLASLPEAERSSQVQRQMQEDAQKPFDLSHGPLLRCLLIQEGDEQFSFLLTVHHIAFDGWSMGVFLDELGKLYQAYIAGQSSPLPELNVQVADFAYWQQQFLQDQAFEEYLTYWKSHLDGELPLLMLPIDHPRPVLQTYAGAQRCHLLPPALLESIESLGRKENASSFMVLLAALQTFLFRYTGQTDIIIGTPLANRSQSKMESLIGFFVNSLPIRSSLSGNPTFRSFLQKVRLTALDVQTYQDLPLEKLVEELRIERPLSHNSLFQVMLVVPNVSLRPAMLPELSIEYVGDLGTGTSKFDMTIEFDFQKKAPCLSIEYATDLFEPETIDRMMDHFEILLQGIADHPDWHIAGLPILTPGERQKLLYDWNDAVIDYPQQVCIHALFEAQAARTPNSPALIFEDQILTYHELNERSNQLAHYLHNLGIGPEALVGVCMERTPDLIVALLSVLKAGGAYVPLDPAYPSERMAFMLEDTHASVLISQESLLSRLPQEQAHILCLDRDWPAIANEDSQNPAPIAQPENLGYIIYTSGSTGRPKGVAITHHSAVVMLAWAADTFPSESLKRVLAATSICFDLSIYELFLPLSQGGAIVLAANALQLHQLPARETITLVNTVPSVMAELVHSRHLPASIQIVNLAGEPLRRILAQQVYEHSHAHSVYNLYGPSEDTTYSTYARIDRGDSLEPSIGRPLSCTQAYVLDKSLQLVPCGLIGELYLAGEGLSRGYLNRPDLTAERYLPDPFGGKPGGRMYKTGDLVRYRPNGNLEFLGRADHQVKIRGFRVELGEIETALAHYPFIQDVAVVAVAMGGETSGAEDKRLVAYLVPKKGESLSIPELRGFLKESLPEYMLPSAFVPLDALPLTPNGKVDRKALPALDAVGFMSNEGYVAPETPLEVSLAAMWSEVLRVPKVGSKDNFFNLGGHSLLATQVLARVRETQGVDIPLRTLFEAPTVTALAEAIETARQSGATLKVPSFDDEMEGGLL